MGQDEAATSTTLVPRRNEENSETVKKNVNRALTLKSLVLPLVEVVGGGCWIKALPTRRNTKHANIVFVASRSTRNAALASPLFFSP